MPAFPLLRPALMRSFALLLPLLVAACSSPAPMSGSAGAPQSSPECQAARLRPVDAMPVSFIPDDVLRKAQSGWVAVRFDVAAGKAKNATVIGSNPPGLYDAYVLRHVSAYAEPSGATVSGCITTTTIKF